MGKVKKKVLYLQYNGIFRKKIFNRKELLQCKKKSIFKEIPPHYKQYSNLNFSYSVQLSMYQRWSITYIVIIFQVSYLLLSKGYFKITFLVISDAFVYFNHPLVANYKPRLSTQPNSAIIWFWLYFMKEDIFFWHIIATKGS